MNLYTVGYRDPVTGKRTHIPEVMFRIEARPSHRTPLVVDIRARRYSPGMSEWIGRGPAMVMEAIRWEYKWLPALGNPSKVLPWNPMFPKDAADALGFIVEWAGPARNYDVVLLCACADALKCHRSDVADAVKALAPYPLEIIHL